jgi:uncharacterized protein
MTAFNVAGLLREPAGASRVVRLRDHYVTLGPDVELAGPIDLDLQLLRTNRGILARGNVSASLRRICSRCTEPFVDEGAVAIAEEYVPSVDLETGAPLSVAERDEGALSINAQHEIELDPVLHDELALTEPMHPLCRPDCPGLCPECGERLEAGHQAHAEIETDPRLAPLARLLRGDDAD